MQAVGWQLSLEDEAVLFPAPKGSLISRKGQTPENSSPDRAREPPTSSSVILYRRVWLFTPRSWGASTQHLWQKEAFHNPPFLIFISFSSFEIDIKEWLCDFWYYTVYHSVGTFWSDLPYLVPKGRRTEAELSQVERSRFTCEQSPQAICDKVESAQIKACACEIFLWPQTEP